MTTEKSTLAWGQTPWDDLPREELLREVQRLWAALGQASSCLRIARAAAAENSGYWFSEPGSGWRALEMARQIQQPIETKYGTEGPYRSFFRYAVDLLFNEVVGSAWQICDTCQVMLGGGPTMCHQCGTSMRPLTWADMEPKAEAVS